MTKRNVDEYEGLWTWFKEHDAATDAAQARIRATLASNWDERSRPAVRSNMPRRVREERKAVRGELAADCF